MSIRRAGSSASPLSAPGNSTPVFSSGRPSTPPQWDVVRSLFEAGVVAERDRRILLSGRSGDGVAETGPVICACYSVGLAAIRKAIATGDGRDVADIGRTLRAGTNCGSCVAGAAHDHR